MVTYSLSIGSHRGAEKLYCDGSWAERKEANKNETLSCHFFTLYGSRDIGAGDTASGYWLTALSTLSAF